MKIHAQFKPLGRGAGGGREGGRAETNKQRQTDADMQRHKECQ